MTQKLLLLDCDGVIFDSNRLIDEFVQKIEYKASDKYCNTLNKLSANFHNQLHRLEIERSNNVLKEDQLRRAIENIGKLRKAHFLLKDMVLEEVLPKYQGRIDYYAIFQYENTFPGVINKINEVKESEIFDDIYIVSHYNSDNEKDAKLSFFNVYLPDIKVVFVKFHQDEFSLLPENAEKNKTRSRTNKILDFTKQTGIEDFSLTAFIDDTISIIEEARELQVRNCFHKGKRDNTTSLIERSIEKIIYNSTYIGKIKHTKRGK